MDEDQKDILAGEAPIGHIDDIGVVEHKPDLVLTAGPDHQALQLLREARGGVAFLGNSNGGAARRPGHLSADEGLRRLKRDKDFSNGHNEVELGAA